MRGSDRAIDTREVALLGVPTFQGQPNPGTEMGPRRLRDAGLIESIEALGRTVRDFGDVDANIPIEPAATHQPGQPRNPAAVSAVSQRTADKVADIAGDPSRQLVHLGGDHSMSIGTLAGILAARPETGVIWVDAHGDLNTPATSPSGNLHGMVLAILLGLVDPPIPEFAWLSARLEPQRLAFVGLRELDLGEQEYLRQSDVHVFTMSDIDRQGIGPVMEKAVSRISPNGNRPIHMSFDIDSIDPYIAPSTGTRVRGGLSYREAHYVCERVAETGQLASMDLVEINPALQPEAADDTVALGCELILSALGKRIF